MIFDKIPQNQITPRIHLRRMKYILSKLFIFPTFNQNGNYPRNRGLKNHEKKSSPSAKNSEKRIVINTFVNEKKRKTER